MQVDATRPDKAVYEDILQLGAYSDKYLSRAGPSQVIARLLSWK
jgi:hypothetical protein